MNTIEAIENTIKLAKEGQKETGKESIDNYFEEVTRNLKDQSNSLIDRSSALVTEAERINIEIENALGNKRRFI
jgi:hypothetical protein